jgi:E3 ubiquitin-protein ligase RFWD2
VPRRWDAHPRRVWSVEFAPAGGPGGGGAATAASGSDDRTVKVWALNQARAALTLDAGANVCSVAHHPARPHTLAVGGASHHALIYDLRSPRAPLATLRGHAKAVSYVRWLSDEELVTSSIDSTVRLWTAGGGAWAAAGAPDAGGGDAAPDGGDGGGGGGGGWACTRVFTGHTNYRNFVGLGVCGPFIACGSETNDVAVYYKGVPHPVLRVPLRPPGGVGGAAGGGGGGGGSAPAHFVSAVCWRGSCGGDGGGGDAGALLAANSQGGIWLLSLS